MECGDLPPGGMIPQAPVDPALALSRSRDGQGAWAAVARYGRRQTATPRHNPRWTISSIGDRLNHPRYRDFAMIPVADFLQ